MGVSYKQSMCLSWDLHSLVLTCLVWYWVTNAYKEANCPWPIWHFLWVTGVSELRGWGDNCPLRNWNKTFPLKLWHNNKWRRIWKMAASFLICHVDSSKHYSIKKTYIKGTKWVYEHHLSKFEQSVIVNLMKFS